MRSLRACACSALLGCNVLTGASNLVADGDGSAPIPFPPPQVSPSPDSGETFDAGPDDVVDESSHDASGDFTPFDGGDASTTLIVFATSTKTLGNFGSVAAANAICQGRAQAVGRRGTFVAWLSANGDNALPHVVSAGPWYLTTGELAVQRSQLGTDNGITHEIDRDESGNAADDEAWTGTRAGAFYIYACNTWTSSSSANGGTVGNVTGNGGGWTAHRAVGCGNMKRLYCFQN
jgi:hypothetical protein